MALFTKPSPDELVLIAEVNDNKLFRIGDTGTFYGDFYFVDAHGEEGYIDTGYLIVGGENGDEAQLIADFTRDYQ